MQGTPIHRRALTVLAAIAGVLCLSLATAPVANATNIVGNCKTAIDEADRQTGRWMCLYYNSPAYGLNAEYGSGTTVTSFNHNINGNKYYRYSSGPQGSAGAWQLVWNNAGGAKNWDAYSSFRVHYNSWCEGQTDIIAPGDLRTLSKTYNDNASMSRAGC